MVSVASQIQETQVHQKLSGFLERQLVERVGPHPLAQAKALQVYRATRYDDIFDPHTHYPVSQIVLNRGWDNPTELFLGVPNAKRADGTDIGFDHYAARVMSDNGVDELLVFGREDKNSPLPDIEFEKERFAALVGAFEKAYPNPSVRWFMVALEEVFGITTPVKAENATLLWDQISEKLKTDDFKPQQLLLRHNVRVALTTDSPHDSLEYHTKIKADAIGLQLLPTFRPDRILYPEPNTRFPQGGDFRLFLQQLSDASGMSIQNFNDCLNVLRNRMDYFTERGCIAMDLGFENFSDKPIDKNAAAAIFAKVMKNETVSSEEGQCWKAYMMAFLCEEAAERKWTQYFHQGAARNVRSKLLKAHGADVGGDAPGDRLNRVGLQKLLDYLDSKECAGSVDGTALGKSVFFTMNAEDYSTVIDTINCFQSNNSGISSKLQMGPPWWMNDTADQNGEFIRMLGNRGTLQNTIGMLSDARSLPPVIGRFIEYRMVLAAELVKIFHDRPVEEIIEIAKKITHKNCAEFLGVDIAPKVATPAETAIIAARGQQLGFRLEQPTVVFATGKLPFTIFGPNSENATFVSLSRRAAEISKAAERSIIIEERGTSPEGKRVHNDYNLSQLRTRSCTTRDELLQLAAEAPKLLVSNNQKFDLIDNNLSGEPTTFIGKFTLLMAALYHKDSRTSQPVQVMPLELMPQNGQTLYDAVLRQVDAAPAFSLNGNPIHKVAFKSWLTLRVAWWDTIVDQIVAAREDSKDGEIHIKSEPYSHGSLILQPAKVTKENYELPIVCPVSGPTVASVENLEVYSLRKLGLLNAVHIAAVAGAMKAGTLEKDTVRDWIAKGPKLEYLSNVRDEILEVLLARYPEDKELFTSFGDAVLKRFDNDSFDHNLRDIHQGNGDLQNHVNYLSKVQVRIGTFFNIGISLWGREVAERKLPNLKQILEEAKKLSS